MRQRDFCRRDVHFFQHDIQHLITQSQPPWHMDIHRRVGVVTLCQRRCPQAVTLRLGKRGRYADFTDHASANIRLANTLIQFFINE
ncbi:Uncharacterised protein [Salmonella enterica subsp. enterica serovar Typhi]|nr:Uncharacterised protein [Salmonella enterica subsp. enterica serovar Typhi]